MAAGVANTSGVRRLGPDAPDGAALLDRPLRRGVARGDGRPVHDVPPRVEVVGAAGLVLEVVGVLPDVDAEQRDLAGGDRVVLVGAADHGEAVAVEHEPGPAGAELVDAGFLELGLEVREGAERGGDRFAELAARLAAAARAHALPEERVVVVPAAVVFDGTALGLGHGVEILQHVLDRGVRERRALQRGVDLVDVGLVVLVVMEFHRRLVDVRLQGVVCVGKRRYGVGHGRRLLVGLYAIDDSRMTAVLSEGPCRVSLSRAPTRGRDASRPRARRPPAHARTISTRPPPGEPY